MERHEIQTIVYQQIRSNIDSLEEGEIDPSRSMADYGASSLDMVEVVSAAMRSLRIRIPRTRLAELKNIDELIDLLWDAKKQSA